MPDVIVRHLYPDNKNRKYTFFYFSVFSDFYIEKLK